MSQLKVNIINGRLNEQFIELMDHLASIMLKKGEPFRARAYQKAQESIMSYSTDIFSPNDIKNLSGIGDTIMDKLNEYVETGTLQIIEREKNNPVNVLTEVYGIGPVNAKSLVEKGIISIPMLRENQHLLNDVQKIGLQYYEDILQRIPRGEIEEYKIIFESAFKGSGKMEIVGSYRRGAQTSGDIDVIITSNSPDVFTNFIDNLIKSKVILHILSRGPTKTLVISKIPTSKTSRRVDFLYTTPNEFPFAILYFTGSKIFNTVMRHIALEKGFTMNEHGIYKMESKKKGNKVQHVFNTEKDIFTFLGLEYKSPVERTDGRAIILANNNAVKTPNVIPNASNIVNIPKKNLIIINDDDDINDHNWNWQNIVTNFKKNGISVLEKLNESQLTLILREANKAYYNKQPVMNDNQYDIIKEYIETKYPNNLVVHEIGAQVDRNKVTLPYHMGSMNKIKPDTSVLSNWVLKYSGEYVLSCKLDGVSGLYTTEGDMPKLYTRGDGIVGQDISHLIPYLKLPKTKGLVIRGEFIIPKQTFNNKYKNTFANPRNMVAGIINHKTINENVNDLRFVAYELIKPIKKPTEQMEFLKTLNVEQVLYAIKKTINNQLLSDILLDWREKYKYEIDGVIVTNNQIYKREMGNPDYAFAFKMVLTEQVAEAKVVDVIWTASKDGYLKPRVQIEPINLGGVQIMYATGFNGSFIYNNKIGIGSVIELIRSGDVIPYIRKVIVPAEEPKMPSTNFKWNETNIDILLEEEDLENDISVREKNIVGFFKGIGVEGLSAGNIKRIMDAGYTSVSKILNMSINDFLKIDGFKEKMANKLYGGIRTKILEANMVTLMAVSNMFGRGFSVKKIELIMEHYPNILVSNDPKSVKIEQISSIKGMAIKTAEMFVERIPHFIQFMNETQLTGKMNNSYAVGINTYDSNKSNIDTNHILYNKTIIITGFRDKHIEQIIKNVGAKLGTSVSKNTFIVLVKDINEDTSNANKARNLNIPLMLTNEFLDKYKL